MSFLNKNSSTSTQKQSTETNTSSENNNIQPSGSGSTAFGRLSAGGSVTINSLSSDADLAKHTVDAAIAINNDSLSLAKALNSNVVDFATSTNRTVAQSTLDATQNALQFGERAFGTVDSSLAGVSRAYSDAAAQVATNESDTFGFLKTLFQGTQDVIGNTVSSLNEIGKQQNTSADQRVADTATTTVKYAVIGVAILALSLAVVFSSRR